MGRELAVLVDPCAEQPPQLLGSSGYGDARLVRRDLGGVWKPLSVVGNFQQLAWRLIGRNPPVRAAARMVDGGP
jgi:hypothetical protein